ncbi:MAG: glycosyltransferase family 1 protein, partial [Armatimonadota bacterium]
MPSPIRLLHVLEATVGGTRRHVLDLCVGLPADRFVQHLVYSSIRNPDFEADAQHLRQLGLEATALPMRRSIEPVED